MILVISIVLKEREKKNGTRQIRRDIMAKDLGYDQITLGKIAQRRKERHT